MPTEPLTFLVSRRVDPARQQDFTRWMLAGETLAAGFDGFLGAGLFAPPPGDDTWQIMFRFADEASLAAWMHAPERSSWLAAGTHLVQASEARCASGLDSWFTVPPPRWKQAVAVWLAFFPVSLLMNAVLGEWLAGLPLLPRVLLSTLALTPLMVCGLIPLVTRLLRRWLQADTPFGLKEKGGADFSCG
ncbi:antibiotic biosynthesis monooxygenase [Craterilacuibacter sp.]|uniref:antibiotic biosynthesis monooxygenase n=1 Tax=Craterilacuibacter sp. TaxID=2870909 RepID=UPI003F3CBCAA